MDVGELVENLAGKLSDLGLKPAVPLTEGNVHDLSPGSTVASLLPVVVTEIRGALSSLDASSPAHGIDLPPMPSTWDAAALHAVAAGLGYCYPRADVPLLLDFVVSELQALRMMLAEQHATRLAATPVVATLPGELQLLCKRLSTPVSDDTLQSAPQRALLQIKAKIAKLMEGLPAGALNAVAPLLDASTATSAVLDALADINAFLADDYALRREMMIKRLDVTITSFLWSAKAEGRESEIMAAIAHRRRNLSARPAAIRPEDAFSTGPELAILLSQRVTDASSTTMRHSSVKGVIIGAVPDRGGRVNDMKLSERDTMPSWQKRREGASGGAGNGRRGGRGGGSGRSSPSHDDRARALLAEAAAFEGEAKTAAEEYDADEGGGDAGGGTPGPHGRGGGGGGRDRAAGGWRGRGGAGGKRGGR